MSLPDDGGRAVRPFVRADIAAAAAMLARAFADDPVMSWIFPDEEMRRRRLPPFFAGSLRDVSARHDGTEVLAAGDGALLGCAIWMPPGTWRPPLGRQLIALPGLLLRLGSQFGVASTTYGAMVRVHPERPHWYLSGIGTDPPVQGTGVGGGLMRSRLARCDAAGLPAYLESSKQRNVPFYERHGFRVTRELPLPGGGPTIWLMWRDPQPV
jgi:GNAT superfamily N-acetyltransferase